MIYKAEKQLIENLRDCLENDEKYALDRITDNKCNKCAAEQFVMCDEYCDSKTAIRDLNHVDPSMPPYLETLDENLRGRMHKFASLADTDKVIKLLKKGADPSGITSSGLSPMYFAVMSGCPHMVQLLIDWGNDVDEKIPHLSTKRFIPILHLAVLRRSFKVVQQLLHSGANVNKCDLYENTALHLACQCADVKLVRLLLAHGARVADVTKDGHTPLMIAVVAGKCKVLRVLVDHGADVRQRNQIIAFEAIHYAVLHKNEKIIRNLFYFKADVNALTRKNQIPLHFAIYIDIKNVNNDNCCLEQGSQSIDNDVRKSCPNSNKNCMTALLLRYGADVNHKDDQGYTALHVVIWWGGCRHLVQMLLDNGADINALSNEGQTPLQLEALKNERSLDIIRLLLIYGSNYKQLFINNPYLFTDMDLLFAIKRFRIARHVAGFSNEFYKIFYTLLIKKQELCEFRSECISELEEMKTNNLIGNVTAWHFLNANRQRLAHLMGEHRASELFKIMPDIEGRYPNYGPMLRRNWATGRRYSTVVKKAVTSLISAVNKQLPLVPLNRIIAHLDYGDMKALIRAVNEKCTNVK